MPSKFQIFSLKSITILTLETIYEKVKNKNALQEPTDLSTETTHIILDWMESLNGLSLTTNEDVHILRDILYNEFDNGTYLQKGNDVFLGELASFIGDSYENWVFFQITREAIFQTV